MLQDCFYSVVNASLYMMCVTLQNRVLCEKYECIELPAELSIVFDLFNLNYLLLGLDLLNRHICVLRWVFAGSQVVGIKLEVIRRCLTRVVLLGCFPVFLSFSLLQQCFEISHYDLHPYGG